MNKFEYDIFLIYKPRDAKIVESLASKLNDAGVRVWLDRWRLVPGADWQEALKQGMAQSGIIAICVGDEGIKDDETLGLALSLQEKEPSRLIVPVIFNGASAANLPPVLKQKRVPEAGYPEAGDILDKLALALLSIEQFTAVRHLFAPDGTAAQKWATVMLNFFKGVAPGAEEAMTKEAGKSAPKVEERTEERRAVSGGIALQALALQLLRGRDAEPNELLRIAVKLKREKSFGLARRLLFKATRHSHINDDHHLRLKIHQQLALCTYKDPDLPLDARLDLALDTLREVESLRETTNQETLGLTGAIYKRKWEVDEQRSHLERSFLYYLRGYNLGPENDQGYTGINAAYILDLLAHQEEEEADKASMQSATVEQRRAQAREIRLSIIQKVAPLVDQPSTSWLTDQWWFYSTVAEAYFGLGSEDPDNYDKAVEWLERGRWESKEVADWEYESTVRQLAAIASLQSGVTVEDENAPSWKALQKFMGQQVAPVRNAFIGKIGLGLSGGGFRASLFHIGVLARLAELDVLRRVEVLSCVSGGSIVGAHYYLEVRHLLRSKSDAEITREDYINIIKLLERDFLAGVQRNVRTRVAAEVTTNLKMLFLPNYSRTLRVGELYEQEIYSRIKDGEGDAPRWLNDLFIKPQDEPADFNPKYHNWRREAKVPILILNATTLNTGHNWQFTASWMGEPPASINTEVDGNELFMPMYYQEAPVAHRLMRLGHAVAASACVPGLFEPLALADLYPERTVRLVDGGVHDNQGVAALLNEDCNLFLISDASGQMTTLNNPSAGLLGVPLRSNSILMARVREAEFRELDARRRSLLARGLMFLHLKKDLKVDPVSWIGSETPFDPSLISPTGQDLVLTRYGIRKDVQELLAAIRTDLDSFSDREAYALMASGYRMAEFEFEKCIKGFHEPEETTAWRFLAIEKYLDGPNSSDPEAQTTMKFLTVARHRGGKLWKLSRNLRMFALLTVLSLLLLVASCVLWWPVLMSKIALVLLAVSASLFILAKLINRRKPVADIIIGIGLTFGFILALIHLYIFDRLYLKWGQLKQ